jgi:tektin-1
MARPVKSPQKYLLSEWHTSNRLNYSSAEKERAAAERLRAECERLRKETDATTTRTQQDTAHKFSQRLRDVDFWKTELQCKLADNGKETELQLQRKEQLEQALVSTQFPLEVAQTCLGLREQRTAIDLVQDDVEVQLLKEVEVIQAVQDSLQKTLDHAVEQIRVMRSCKVRLEKDLRDKFGAHDIDNTCASLTEKHRDLTYSPEAVKIQTNSITPEQWASSTDSNIEKAEAECKASATLRGVIDSVLDQCARDIESQRAKVNLAFEKRTQEIADAKQTLEQHLEKVLKEIESMEKNIEELSKTAATKQGPMKLAHTRLELRTYRPNTELVRDPVQYGLVGEVDEISGSIQQLQARLADSEDALKGLIRCQLSLEEDIGIKSNSLNIEGQCVALRKQLSTAPQN